MAWAWEMPREKKKQESLITERKYGDTQRRQAENRRQGVGEE